VSQTITKEQLDSNNARLIAAAPELLEALELALSELIQISGYETGTNGPIYKAMQACRDAVAKATGGAE
jgi:hypothetical protein